MDPVLLAHLEALDAAAAALETQAVTMQQQAHSLRQQIEALKQLAADEPECQHENRKKLGAIGNPDHWRCLDCGYVNPGKEV